MIKSIQWTGEKLRIVDQTQLPERLIYRDLSTVEEVFEAIRKLRVRGAPAIGVTAAYGLHLALRSQHMTTREELLSVAEKMVQYLSQARPTAVNLRWALEWVLNHLQHADTSPEELIAYSLKLAHELQQDDETRCRKIGAFGAELIQDGMTILTHCNTGALATAGIGTALGIVYTAHQQGKRIQVLVDETRPLLQGARLTMWELHQAGIPARLITDNMAAYAMQQGMVDVVIVGADRITRNGDVANKIGTYNLSVLCQHHHIPFYVAAPLSTFDVSLDSGKEIPIEQRPCSEVTHIWDRLPITVADADCWNPAFDVTPAHLISGIVTETGVLSPPYADSIQRLKINSQIHQNNKELIV